MEHPVSKQKKAFLRKLYLAYLIDNERHNLLSLCKATGMPRRTLQDAISAFVDLGIECHFIQDGERHNAGYYHIHTWGPISSSWVRTHLDDLLAQLND
ncbi:winged helix-turn-helix domain-containing protein [Shewanella sp. AS1]|uniref:winged helix-turn-helix domain-containing protein n=1 Tax=Shewanella sp. AS1 TaxID=2907626 RepID=UPI001F40F602|nr:winged helix-turn-helix domain-containing protein [Shewanella sp. AS1]MCE9677807.1 winged helix-turn-helix domain-containing protein [Shewanella sp. AS1]